MIKDIEITGERHVTRSWSGLHRFLRGLIRLADGFGTTCTDNPASLQER